MSNLNHIFFIIILIILVFVSAFYSLAQEPQEEKLNNLSNQDKILEQKIVQSNDRVESLKEYSNWKFESLNEKINDLKTLLFILIGALATLIGYVIYDRRAALSPLELRITNLERRSEMIIDTLQGMANKDIRLIELLSSIKTPESKLYEEKIERFEQDIENLMNSELFSKQL